MSDLRKAIEELAERWEQEQEQDPNGYHNDLREVLAANPEPEAEEAEGFGLVCYRRDLDDE